MEIDWAKIQPVKDTLSDNFVIKLTKKDCEAGYHCYRTVGQDNANFYEKCRTCGDVIKISKFGASSSEIRGWWQRKHKLDLLQPYGSQHKNFVKYYGEPTKQS